jgi:hypothetical protein
MGIFAKQFAVPQLNVVPKAGKRGARTTQGRVGVDEVRIDVLGWKRGTPASRYTWMPSPNTYKASDEENDIKIPR